MPSYLIKADRDVDLYIEWSTVVEAPAVVGTRQEMIDHLMRPWNPEYRERYEFELSQVVKRLDRADTDGTSSWFGCGWDDAGEIFIQRGFLRREDILAAARIWQENIDEADRIVAMCEPLDGGGDD